MKQSLVLLLILCSSHGFGQGLTKYLVEFTDKNNSPYSVTAPSAYLSSKAIQRRANQNIAVNTSDLPVNPSYVNGVSNTGVTVVHRSKWLNAVIIETLDTNLMAQVRSLAYVKSAAKVRRMKRSNDMPGKLPLVIKQENNGNARMAATDYGDSYRQINMLNGDALHNLGYRGQNMVIAVLDAGFERVNDHPAFDSLRNENRILGTKDFVDGDNNVYAHHWHGMSVLSTMAGNIPGQLVGTAPKANYWLLRSEDADTEYLVEEANWVVAAEFADSVGADIINSSLGYTTFNDPAMNHTYGDMDGNSTIITKGADIAASKGILVVNSAGNEGDGSWNFIGAPADGDSVLAVGAVDSSAVYAFFSSEGPSSDGRIKPNVTAMGFQAVLADPWSNGIFKGNGTSFSGPIIAGMAACLWQSNPTKGNMEVFRSIEQSAHKYSNPDGQYGYGIPNFSLARLYLTDVQQFPSKESTNILVYPNPFESSLNFIIYSTDSQEITLEVSGIKGDLIGRQSLFAAEGSFTPGLLDLPSGLAKGMYLVKLSCKNTTLVTRIVKD